MFLARNVQKRPASLLRRGLHLRVLNQCYLKNEAQKRKKYISILGFCWRQGNLRLLLSTTWGAEFLECFQFFSFFGAFSWLLIVKDILFVLHLHSICIDALGVFVIPHCIERHLSTNSISKSSRQRAVKAAAEALNIWTVLNRLEKKRISFASVWQTCWYVCLLNLLHLQMDLNECQTGSGGASWACDERSCKRPCKVSRRRC